MNGINAASVCIVTVTPTMVWLFDLSSFSKAWGQGYIQTSWETQSQFSIAHAVTHYFAMIMDS